MTDAPDYAAAGLDHFGAQCPGGCGWSPDACRCPLPDAEPLPLEDA